MPLETGSTIDDLDKTWPLGGDPHNKGDDHIRLVKAVLQSQFPGINGNGFAKIITASEDEINYLGGASSNIQDQLDTLAGKVDGLEGNLSAPPGTILTFFNPSPPTGWTQDVSHNDAMMRVVSGVGGGFGGSDSPILNDKVPTHGHTTQDAGEHTHSADALRLGGDYYNVEVHDGPYVSQTEKATSSDGSHSHTVNNNVGSNWTPKYVNLIIAAKD